MIEREAYLLHYILQVDFLTSNFHSFLPIDFVTFFFVLQGYLEIY